MATDKDLATVITEDDVEALASAVFGEEWCEVVPETPTRSQDSSSQLQISQESTLTTESSESELSMIETVGTDCETSKQTLPNIPTITEVCGLCNKTLLKKSMASHMRRHSEDFHIKCPECPSLFFCNDAMREHLAREHMGTGVCKCNTCGKIMQTFRGMREHIKQHSGEQYDCDKCDKKFTTKSRLSRHMKTHVKSFVCEVCDHRFATRTELKGHSVIHVDQPTMYKCSSCSYQSRWKSAVSRHVTVTHSDSRSHICDICGRTFKERSNLARHKKNVKCDRTPVSSKWTALV